MTSESFHDISTEISSGTLKVRIMELQNGLLILLSDSDEFRLGLSAVAMPGMEDRKNPTSTGIFTFDTNAMLIRTLSEQITTISGQSCMVISSVRNLNQLKLMEIMNVLKGILTA
ncbi:MAG: hypothetical protein BAJATHORv1_20323 [Candidatus Thorarchaeota archaeon]|nr:MAG: hypothetical protein BAJATHORv1_20323 [Candidatus Thorarchaeota archaeon]